MKLPESFVFRMSEQLGSEFEPFKNALNQIAPVSIRINPLKTAYKLNSEKIDWCENGYYLTQRPIFSSDPAWHQGLYYVQEAGSMLLEKAFYSARSAYSRNIRILDLCAAPGGKSTHLTQIMAPDDVLVSNEVIKSRVGVLEENLRKSGHINTIITNADSKDFADKKVSFDIIVADVPCSGEGLFRKDIDSIQQWSLENVKTCELRQRRILENIIQCINPGGFLIYSTCTYNPGENEDQIQYLLENGFELSSFEVSGSMHSHYACLPHKTKSEGFFIALLRKSDGQIHVQETQKSKFKPFKKHDFQLDCLNTNAGLFEYKNQLSYISQELKEFYDSKGMSEIHTVSVGWPAAEIKEKIISPSAHLPFSYLFDTNQIETFELDQEQALKYLSKEPIRMNSNSKGYVALMYQNKALGLGKFAGNRINNLFPHEWKLRKIPAQDELFSIHHLFDNQ